MADFTLYPNVIGQGGPNSGQMHHLNHRRQRLSLQDLGTSYLHAYGHDDFSQQLSTHAPTQNLSPTGRPHASHTSPSLSPHSVVTYKAEPQPSTPHLSQFPSSPVKLSRSTSQVSSVSAGAYQPMPPQQQQQQSTYPQQSSIDYFSSEQIASMSASAGLSMAPSYDPSPTTYDLDLTNGVSTHFGSHSVLHSK